MSTVGGIKFSGRRIALVYLNSGNGHLAQALALQQLLHDTDPELHVTLLHGFGKRNRLLNFVFEKGYGISCNYESGAFSLIYDIGEHECVLRVLTHLFAPLVTGYLKRQLQEQEISDVISFHFATTPFLAKAIRATGRDIRLAAVCTDPFTAPRAWFRTPRADLFVYSQELRQQAIAQGMAPDRVRIIPFLLAKKYRELDTGIPRGIRKARLGFAPGVPLLLIAGGGNGLPGARKIVAECVRLRIPCDIAVICGRNTVLAQQVQLLARQTVLPRIRTFSFIDNMEEFLCAADLAVTKAGASAVFEAIACRCPVILSHYIYNQELGNMRYVVRHGYGYFIQEPEAICRRIQNFFRDMQGGKPV